jgi:hypothetical protein
MSFSFLRCLSISKRSVVKSAFRRSFGAAAAKKHANFGKLDKVLLGGFGSIGKGMLPLILRHFDVDPKNVTVLDPDGIFFQKCL